ncbi:MAG: STAS/SEC14 domain-containing protein [Candidatus Saccharimonadales bacterium]
MANRIFYNPEGYVEVKVEGDQTYMSFENVLPTALDILDELQKKGQDRLGLIDLSKEGAFTPDSNKAAMQILESLNYDKLAMFGAGRVISDVAKAIVLAMGKGANTKIFNTREEALKWLMAKDDGSPQASDDQQNPTPPTQANNTQFPVS